MCYLGYGKDDGVSSIIDIRLNQGYAFQIMGYYGSFFIQIKKKMRLWFCQWFNKSDGVVDGQ